MDAYPNVVGIKDSENDLSGLIAFRHAVPDAKVLVGNDDHFFSAMQAGCDGCISGNANVVPELFVAAWRHFHEGRSPIASQLQSAISCIARATQYGCVPLLREGMRLRGLPIGPAIAPFTPPSNEDTNRLEKEVASALEMVEALSRVKEV